LLERSKQPKKEDEV